MHTKVCTFLLYFCALATIACKEERKAAIPVHFTKADSVTDVYLSLHDSLHQVWNLLINNDNHKIEAMHNLVHELMTGHPQELDLFKGYEERIDQLMRMRYTQRSMTNFDVVAEYDEASNSLVDEIIAFTQSKNEYVRNQTVQDFISRIREAELHIYNYRLQYDSTVQSFNKFVDANRSILEQNEYPLGTEKKALFKVVSE